MEDTILPDQSFAYRSQPLRITFKSIDYMVQLLDKEISNGSNEVRILLDGIVQTLIRTEGRWRFAETTENEAFAQAIWYAISLRYRL